LREKDAARAAAASLRREQEAKAGDKRTKSNSPAAVSASPPERKEDNNGDNENNTDEKSNDDVENRRNGGYDGGHSHGEGDVEMTHQRGSEGGPASTVGGGCPLGEDDEPYDPASDYHNIEGNGRGNYSQIVVGSKNNDSEEQEAL
jgi:hypothetical protein